MGDGEGEEVGSGKGHGVWGGGREYSGAACLPFLLGVMGLVRDEGVSVCQVYGVWLRVMDQGCGSG